MAENTLASGTSRFHFEVTSMALHIMAMAFMLCDHLWGTIVPGNDWLTYLGRIAFPIFAFMIVEGYFHTHNLKKYVKRLFIAAIISEIPFNLMTGGDWFYPIHQNVLWTFLIGIGLIFLNEKAKAKGKICLRVVTAIGIVLLGAILGLVCMVDFYHAGVLTVLAFYFFRGRKWWNFLLQFIALYFINVNLLGGQDIPFMLFGSEHFFPVQGFALFALIPIWLYRGKQGPYNKGLKYLYYGFYPVHMLILGLIQYFGLNVIIHDMFFALLL